MLAFCVIGVLIFGEREIAGQCTCAYLPGSKYLSAHEALKTSDVVFTGKIVEVMKGASRDEYDVKFKIDSVWKKDVGESVVLRTHRGACGFFGKKGGEYLIYAYVRKGKLTTHGCTRTRYLADAGEDLKEFEEKGEQPVRVYETK